VVAIDQLGQRVKVDIERRKDLVQGVAINEFGKACDVNPQDRSLVSFGRQGAPAVPDDLDRLCPGSAREERADDSQQVLAAIIDSPSALAKMSQFQDKLPGELVFLLLLPVLFSSSEIRVLEFAHLHVHFPAPFQIQEVQNQRPTD